MKSVKCLKTTLEAVINTNRQWIVPNEIENEKKIMSNKQMASFTPVPPNLLWWTSLCVQQMTGDRMWMNERGAQKGLCVTVLLLAVSGFRQRTQIMAGHFSWIWKYDLVSPHKVHLCSLTDVQPIKSCFLRPLAHLNWSFQLRFLEAQPHHANDRHGNAKPIKEAEEVDDREYVIGESVEESHDTLWGESKEKVV